MLKRKIENILLNWKNNPTHKPLVVKGCRQCGKTSSVCSFAKKYYENVIYLNFFENPNLNSIFSGSLEIDNLKFLISSTISDAVNFIDGKTVIIFDEIQVCPKARTALKFFHLDGRYDVIATGSLLGISGYDDDKTVSVPVGYEQQIQMFPMDFEEFLWANHIDDKVIDVLKKALKDETPVAEALHNKLNDLFMRFAVVGGMPNIVQHYVDTMQLNTVLQMQRDLIASYADDMVKYASKKDKSRIRECFYSIPKQLAKENKKFQFSTIKKGARSSQYNGSLQWIIDAGIAMKCHNLTITELPLSGNAIDSIFKIYIEDNGLFVSMLDDGAQFDFLNGGLYSYKGAIFENLIAGELHKIGRDLYYYHKDSGLEIDFVMRHNKQCSLVEVKATTGDTKSTKTILSHPKKYHVFSAIKLGNYNVGRADKILTLPHYMTFLLRNL